MANKRTLNVFIRSTLFWAIMGSTSLIFTFLAFSLLPFEVKFRHKLVIQWSIFFTWVAKHLCKVNYIVTGIENLPKGPAIIASNHQSIWETMSFNTIFPQHIWILKRELIKIPLFGWTLATLSPIAIDRANRKAASEQIIEQSIDRIKHGFWILIFPEGTRIKPGVSVPYKVGVSKMALSLKIPVIPVSHNAGLIVPKSSFLLFPGIINVIISKPIIPIQDETPQQLTKKIEDVIKSNLESISSKSFM